jgi:hypothetical protein
MQPNPAGAKATAPGPGGRREEETSYVIQISPCSARKIVRAAMRELGIY